MVMADQKTLLQKYVSDMVALESHIYQAIDKQVKENIDEPDVKMRFQTFAKTLEAHQSTLADRLKALGGAANSPVKEGVAAALGIAAGVIDKFRSEEVSKDFRDDFTALCLSLISYQMLYTTAVALGDRQTADLAATNVKDNAQFVNYIQQILPQVVVSELKKNHEVSVDASAVEETKNLVDSIWK
jgi:ferritin-like metal-binding protein YciE